MENAMTVETLRSQNRRFRGTGAVSAENRERGFRPAFFDSRTSTVYPSRFADGRPAPFHLLDGLPDEVVAARDPAGRVLRVKGTVIAGFVREDRFYTREAAAARMAEPN